MRSRAGWLAVICSVKEDNSLYNLSPRAVFLYLFIFLQIGFYIFTLPILLKDSCFLQFTSAFFSIKIILYASRMYNILTTFLVKPILMSKKYEVYCTCVIYRLKN